MASLSQDLPETVLLSLLEADHKSFHKIARGGNEEKLLRSTVYFLFLVLLLGYWYLRTNIM